ASRGPGGPVVVPAGHPGDGGAAARGTYRHRPGLRSSPLLGLPEKGPEKEPVDPETAHWLQTATTANQPHLLPAEGPAPTAASHPQAWTEDVADDVRACQALVERAGMEMLVLDQTRPEVGLPVARGSVGALGNCARFATPIPCNDVANRFRILDTV